CVRDALGSGLDFW
nr:immunoglobulin heavy chain junction region [Macaca mulatta]MOX96165.1 immunoglobulin heavy chain junction region [Macaca mulatta]